MINNIGEAGGRYRHLDAAHALQGVQSLQLSQSSRVHPCIQTLAIVINYIFCSVPTSSTFRYDFCV